MTADGLTEDAFLGGRLRLLQPAKGYRAGTDPVFLAAAVPAEAGERVLDLGTGVGTAALCLAARVPGLALHGVEIQPAYAGLAERNAAKAGAAMTVHRGDLMAMPAALKALSFDHVMMNPPFFPGRAATASPDAGRDRAQREGAAGLADWIAAGLRRLREGGRLTLIHRTERLAAILAALDGPAGDAAVLPLAGRAGRPAERVVVTARKARRGPLTLLPPFIVHAGSRHRADAPDFTPEANAILRGEAALPCSGPLDAVKRA